jgi:hypothetical protein
MLLRVAEGCAERASLRCVGGVLRHTYKGIVLVAFACIVIVGFCRLHEITRPIAVNFRGS